MIAASLVVHAITLAKDVALHGRSKRHVEEMNRLQADGLRDLIAAVTERQISVLEKQCSDIMAMFSAQAQSLINQMEAINNRLLDEDSAIKRNSFHMRLSELDTQLQYIRSDALSLFQQMGELLIIVGGKGFNLAQDLSKPLALADLSTSNVIDYMP